MDRQKILSAVRIGSIAVVGVGAMVVLMIWLAGGWEDKVLPGGPVPVQRPAVMPHTITVQVTEQDVYNEAVGTIQAEHEIALSSRLPMPAEVDQINASPGALVRAGEVLVRLNDTEFRARVAQAQALLQQAQADYDRIIRLRASNHATEHEETQATNALAVAKARHAEAMTYLGYTEIRAPVGAPTTQPDRQPGRWVVINKYAEVGDTVQPGQTLVRLYDRLQLVATVPESMRQRLDVGQGVAVHIDAINKTCLARISEIVPQAHRVSRTFQVKVTGPCQAGVIVGMFARMRVPTGQRRREIRIPASAVRRVGQLTTVFVVRGDRLVRQPVQLGPGIGDQVVVTSGLSGGDTIVADVADVQLPGG